MEAVIETDRLGKRYGSARGIEDVTISVDRGKVYGFLGPSGVLLVIAGAVLLERRDVRH